MKFATPLRYPGGKGRLTQYVSSLMEINHLTGGVYAEPFCGGSGVALSLLLAERVSHIYLNDSDPSIFAFWQSVVYHNDELVGRILNTPVNMESWHTQREVQRNREGADIIDLGFSTFFLNRTNRSGILTGGVIGGLDQTGEWKIDARYNRDALVDRIRLIGLYADRIDVTNMDVMDFITDICPTLPINSLIYFDPPYFNKGQKLYKNHFAQSDHGVLAEAIQANIEQPWIVSYDSVPEISELYSNRRHEIFSLNYSANRHSVGSELMVFKDTLDLPDRVFTASPLVA